MSRNPVNPRLTSRSRKNVVENDEYAAFCRRIVRAHSRRIAAGDIEGLADLIRLADTVEAAIRDAVIGLRGFGYTWAEIAARLGVTRQAVQKRWGGDEP